MYAPGVTRFYPASNAFTHMFANPFKMADVQTVFYVTNMKFPTLAHMFVVILLAIKHFRSYLIIICMFALIICFFASSR